MYAKLTPDFKNHMRNLDNFRQWKVQELKLNGLHLSKNYIPSPKTLFTDLSDIILSRNMGIFFQSTQNWDFDEIL